jgi:hypothetical protein
LIQQLQIDNEDLKAIMNYFLKKHMQVRSSFIHLIT